jgi:hypothetical protein
MLIFHYLRTRAEMLFFSASAHLTAVFFSDTSWLLEDDVHLLGSIAIPAKQY